MRIIATATGDDGAEHGDVMDVELTDFFEGYNVYVQVRGGTVVVREDGTTRFVAGRKPYGARECESLPSAGERLLASEDGGERLLQEEGRLPWPEGEG